MSSPLDPADRYRILSDCLRDSPLYPSASESHGMLTGFLCTGVSSVERVWLRELFPDAGDRDRSDLFRSLVQDTRAGMQGNERLLQLLLPEETAPFGVRAQGLYDWVRGFLYGFGVSDAHPKDLSDQAQEILRDLAEITRMDLSGTEGTEEDEWALMELEEFLRVAVLLLFEECRGAHPLPEK